MVRKKLEFTLLLNDLKVLNIELHNKKLKLNHIKKFFNEELTKYMLEHNLKFENNNIIDNIEQIIDDKVQNIEEPKNLVSEKDTKKLYRDIVKLTHTDKNIKSENKEYLTELYIKASNNKDIDNLLLIADELNIDYSNYITDENITLLNDKINIIKTQNLNIEYQSEWIWFYNTSEELKKLMFLNFIKKK